jgi:signal transduction histidine kinase
MASGPSLRRRLLLHWAWVVPAVLCAAAALYRPAFLTQIGAATDDALVRSLIPARPDPRIVIVDIDERSLSRLGQWPWRRDRLGMLIGRLRELGAQTIALDLVFGEPDRSNRPGDDADAAFADVLRGGRVLVGYAFVFNRPGQPPRDAAGCVLHPVALTVVQPPGADGTPMFEATQAICSLPALAAAAGASGFLNAAPDSDGILRRAPMVIAFKDGVYPSLGLAAAMSGLQVPAAQLRAVNANTAALTVGERTLPLDGRANLRLRFRGQRRTFPFVSAADVMAGRVGTDAVKDKIVFVGATALGTQELVATPHDPQFIGVEVQATVADNILHGDFLSRPADASLVEALGALLAAAALAMVVGRFGIVWGSVFAVACVAALWGAAFGAASAWGLLLSPVLPTAAVVLSSAMLAITTLWHATRVAASALRRARSDADAAVQAQNEFLMTVSHELRTPLSAIRGYAQMVAKGALTDQAKVHTLAAIERHAVAQTQVIDDLFEASRSVGGRLRLAVHQVDLPTVVRSVAEALRPAIEARRLRLEFCADDSLGRVMGDPERLRQVVWHLISNAMKFTPEGGRIDVELGVDAGAAQLVVRDTGAGISADVLPLLFTRGSRGGGPRPEAGGLGLGLALVRHIVELHGGSVSGWSNGPGTGATFRVHLPIARPGHGASPLTAPIPPPRLEGVRVIVVDEHAEARGSMASALLGAGASVVTAVSADDALALVRDDSREVLIVNAGIRERAGYWLAREALAIALNRGERLAVIAIVPAGHAQDRDRSLEIGIERHLTAPVDPADLVRAVAEAARLGADAARR